MPRYLVTAGLPYSNGKLHVGHIAGAYLPADTWVRFMRLKGEEVRFICGSDDNGVTTLQAARKEGKTPQELTGYYNRSQATSFAGLGIRFDIYGGTHQPGFTDLHNRLSGQFFKTIYDKGYFVKRTTLQMYDPQANQFLPDRFIKGACYHRRDDGTPCGYAEAYGDQCESCGKMIDPMELIDPVSTLSGATPEPRETTHWYLQLDRLADPIREWLESKREATPEGPAWRDMVLNFSLGQIKNGLPERAMTRDLTWGVPVPLDDPDAEGKVLYVWFDAPIGYVSFTARLCEEREGDAELYTRWWKDPESRIVHFIGEDNTIFHALTWPAMMMAEGTYQLPWQVVVNSFLNIKFPGKEEEKISKSRGTAIWIEEYLKSFDPDPLRYYLTAIAPETHRTTFDIDDFITRNNTELLNALGNFINRTLKFTNQYFEGQVPAPGNLEEIDTNQLKALGTAQVAVTEHLEAFRFRAAMGEVMALARTANDYISEKAPWTQRKSDMAACGTTMNVCLQTVRTLAVLMAPFLPHSAEKCRTMLTLGEDQMMWNRATEELEAGHALGAPETLFRKLDAKELFTDGNSEDKKK